VLKIALKMAVERENRLLVVDIFATEKGRGEEAVIPVSQRSSVRDRRGLQGEKDSGALTLGEGGRGGTGTGLASRRRDQSELTRP